VEAALVSPMRISAIAAMDESRVIGSDNKLPWNLPEDMKRVSSLTRGHTVLMGRKTYESLPEKFRPLPGRQNVVVTRFPEKFIKTEGVMLTESPEGFIKDVLDGKVELSSDKLWIFGGSQIYQATKDYWDDVYLTLVPGAHGGDAHFPDFEDEFELLTKEKGPQCDWLYYARAIKASGN